MRSAPQDQQNQLGTSAESNAYQAARDENDPQTKIKLLDDFGGKYPASALLPEIYREYYLTYFSLGKYPQVIEYADKFAALGEKMSTDSRILALLSREVAYASGCSDPEFRTPEAYLKARDAGKLGLQLMGQWQEPEDVTEEQFASEKKSFGIIFHDVTEMTEAGLAGQAVNCMPKPRSAGTAGPAQDRRQLFDHLIDQIKEQQRRSPQIR
jgi:hypothetical protein